MIKLKSTLIVGELYKVNNPDLPMYDSANIFYNILETKGAGHQNHDFFNEYLLLVDINHCMIGVERFAKFYCFLCPDNKKRWLFPMPKDFEI